MTDRFTMEDMDPNKKKLSEARQTFPSPSQRKAQRREEQAEAFLRLEEKQAERRQQEAQDRRIQASVIVSVSAQAAGMNLSTVHEEFMVLLVSELLIGIRDSQSI